MTDVETRSDGVRSQSSVRRGVPEDSDSGKRGGNGSCHDSRATSERQQERRSIHARTEQRYTGNILLEPSAKRLYWRQSSRGVAVLQFSIGLLL